jgi:NAD(P)-dependent dehydrogenase (short-subunit alcohol dehydrogenase family)
MSNPIIVTGRFEGKVGLVTGGASGIGLAITRRLVAEGASVVVGDVNDASLEAAAKELGNAVACTAADVRVEAQVEAMVRTATRHFGRLDVAFNVAGLGGFGEITELAEADWDLVVESA